MNRSNVLLATAAAAVTAALLLRRKKKAKEFPKAKAVEAGHIFLFVFCVVFWESFCWKSFFGVGGDVFVGFLFGFLFFLVGLVFVFGLCLGALKNSAI